MNSVIIKKRQNFFDSEIGVHIRDLLQAMVSDAHYNTQAAYSADAEQYPDHVIPFVDKHMNYLYMHPALEPLKYIANLRLMTRKR